MLQIIKKFILDTLFPIACLGCQEEEVWLCDGCLSKIKSLTTQVCPYCEKTETQNGKPCHRCRENHLMKNQLLPLDDLLVSTRYKDISRLVHCYKYNFIPDLHIPLGKIMIQGILKNNSALPDAIIPIPLHPRRLRWRGFNQSELLARYISENLAPGFQIPVLAEVLIRQKYTAPQMKISDYLERKKNITGAFYFNPPSPEGRRCFDELVGTGEGSDTNKTNLKNKTVLLVDDIATTGATLFEAGKVLKNSGAKKVFAVVLSRQEITEKNR
jgi:predicted amidophosphoribosyltransferase